MYELCLHLYRCAPQAVMIQTAFGILAINTTVPQRGCNSSEGWPLSSTPQALQGSCSIDIQGNKTTALRKPGNVNVCLQPCMISVHALISMRINSVSKGGPARCAPNCTADPSPRNGAKTCARSDCMQTMPEIRHVRKNERERLKEKASHMCRAHIQSRKHLAPRIWWVFLLIQVM